MKIPDLFEVFTKWWKKILVVVLLAGITAAIIVFLKPKQYLSTATAVPGSSFASDKAAVFNENIQALYSSLGEADDLDRVLGTAALDTVYSSIASQRDLATYYDLKEQGDARLDRAALELKKHVKVSKSGYGELKVRVWDKDKQMAARLANAVLEKLQSIHQDLYSVSNEAMLEGLRSGLAKLNPDSSAAHSDLKKQYEKLINEYQLMVDTRPPALIVTERAKPALYADRPRKKMVITGAIVLAFIFSFLVAYTIEAKNAEA